MSVVQRLRASADAWAPREGASDAEIAQAEAALGRRLHDDHRAVLIAGGGELDGKGAQLCFFEPRNLPRLNGAGDSAHAGLAQVLVFADDEGDFLYFYDPDDLLHRGAWAIFLIAKSSTSSLGRAWYAARDLAQLVERLLDDEDLLDDRSR